MLLKLLESLQNNSFNLIELDIQTVKHLKNDKLNFKKFNMSHNVTLTDLFVNSFFYQNQINKNAFS